MNLSVHSTIARSPILQLHLPNLRNFTKSVQEHEVYMCLDVGDTCSCASGTINCISRARGIHQFRSSVSSAWNEFVFGAEVYQWERRQADQANDECRKCQSARAWMSPPEAMKLRFIADEGFFDESYQGPRWKAKKHTSALGALR